MIIHHKDAHHRTNAAVRAELGTYGSGPISGPVCPPDGSESDPLFPVGLDPDSNAAAVTASLPCVRHGTGLHARPALEWGVLPMAPVGLRDEHAVRVPATTRPENSAGAVSQGGPMRPPVSATGSAVGVCEEAPELLRHLGRDAAARLAQLRAPLLVIERGPWHPSAPSGQLGRHYGLLLLSGDVLRRLTFDGRSGAELLGAGDLREVRTPVLHH
jgi:hypothetical protein